MEQTDLNLDQYRAENHQLDFVDKAPTKAELERLSIDRPIMILFLRHFGCTFCREALTDIAEQRASIEARDVRVVLAHMASEREGRWWLAKYGLENIAAISDPEKKLYAEFGLKRGNIMELLGPKVWYRGFKAAILDGHWVGRLIGDGLQMPGLFLLDNGKISWGYRYRNAADRPDYFDYVKGRYETETPCGLVPC